MPNVGRSCLRTDWPEMNDYPGDAEQKPLVELGYRCLPMAMAIPRSGIYSWGGQGSQIVTRLPRRDHRRRHGLTASRGRCSFAMAQKPAKAVIGTGKDRGQSATLFV